MLGVPAARVAVLLAAARAEGSAPCARRRPTARASGSSSPASPPRSRPGDDAGALLAADVRLTVVPGGRGTDSAVAAWLRAHAPAALSAGRAGRPARARLPSPDGVLVLETAGAAIAALTWFGDPGLAARLGLG